MSPSIDNAKCVLVTGATSGIALVRVGRALALAIASLQRPGSMQKNLMLTPIRTPIDTLVLAAGIQREVHFKKEVDLEAIATEMHVNYFSILTIISFFMPHLLAKSVKVSGHPCLIAPVTSGLAYVPAPWIANYSASKAALHSLCSSLRVQLEDTSIGVIEISPPLVESELHDAEGTTGALSQFWMPLEEYTKETMEGLQRGVNVVCSGMSSNIYEKFEQPKERIITEMAKRAGIPENDSMYCGQ